MIRKFLSILFFLIIGTFCYSNITLKSRFLQANPGDFIVTDQSGNYTILLVRQKSPTKLVLEEISVNRNSVDLKTIAWKEWVKNKAPGAQSWISLHIDLEKSALSQCYSYIEKQWVFIENSDYFVSKLFSLSFTPTKEHERKKIGPAPMDGEIDRRKFWKPQLVREGKKMAQAEYEVLRSKWPADKSILAGCVIEFYLDSSNPHFPFPYWMEIQSSHYNFKVGVVDSGVGMESPMKLIN